MIKSRARLTRCLTVTLFVLMTLISIAAQADVAVEAQTQSGINQADKVDLTSDNLFFDDQQKILTATGAVEIAQAGKIVKADRVDYYTANDRVVASGNVALMETNGDVYFADRLELTNKMKDGVVNHFRTVLKDGSRFTARSGKRINGDRVIMNKATYTPCEPCKLDPLKPPLWQIKADKVVHNSTEKSIAYKNATFELGGVPVVYTPYFSHPDGTEKQKMGFLAPHFSYSSDLGFGVTSQYYIPVDRSEDLTIGARALTEQSPILLGEHRKRFQKGSITTSLSGTYAGHADSVSGQTIETNSKFRGHIFSDGEYNVNKKWRVGYGLQLATDDQYLRQYNFSSEDVLENQLYAERFDDRDYFGARAIAFQDVRVSNRATDQPNIIPEIKASFVGKPNATLGGRWIANTSLLGVARKGNGQDVIRLSGDLGWNKRDILRNGIVNNFTTSIRADAYDVPKQDATLLGAGSNGDAQSVRLFSYAQDVISYPMVKQLDTAQWMIEPTVSIKISPSAKNNASIPNEDSQDVQLDANNIFASDRFPGLDRIEDRSNVTYGARTGIYGDDGSFGDVFLGQSYRLSSGDNPFPNGSGLEQQSSSYVGKISSRYKDKFNLNYSFELDRNNMRPNRHEVDGNLYWGRFGFGTTYLYARALEGTDLLTSREQIFNSFSYQVNDRWRVGATSRYELSETNDKGWRGGALSLDYLGQCLTFSTTIDRSATKAISGEQGLEVMMRLGLKNLGEFGIGQ